MFQPSNYPIGLGDLSYWADGGFYYLASPYTHDKPEVVEQRVETAHRYYSLLTSHGLHIYNAIYETHRVARYYKLPTHFSFWKEHNSAFIKPSRGILIAEVDGWEESRGVKSEIEEARSLELPIFGLRLDEERSIMWTRKIFDGRNLRA